MRFRKQAPPAEAGAPGGAGPTYDWLPRGVPGQQGARPPEGEWALPPPFDAPPWTLGQGVGHAIFLGQWQGRFLSVEDDRHIVTIAGSRAGKGVSLILPNLVRYTGSAVVIDPKGELARKTARYRSRNLRQDVHVLDPFGESGQQQATYNPLAEIDIASVTAVDDAALIADALIEDQGGDSAYWVNAARNVIRALVLSEIALSGKGASLTGMRSILLRLEEVNVIPTLAQTLEGVNLFAIAAYLQSLMNKPDMERGSIISMAIEQTAFLDGAGMQRCLGPSPLSLRALRERATTLYLCLPASRLATHYKWLRVIINLCMTSFERHGAVTQKLPVLVLLEEFAVLGYMPAIEKAAGQIAGFGVKLWTILQDLGQLKAIYRDRWETFFGNAGITTWFGLNDLTSLQYLSQRLGTTYVVRKESTGISRVAKSQGNADTRDVYVEAPLMSPDEIQRYFARERGVMVAMFPGLRPIVVERVRADQHPLLKDCFNE